jgi:serine/threonine-protein kinase HipA
MEDFSQLYANTGSANTNATPTATWRATWAQLAGPEAVQEFVRRIVFSAAIGNDDMHLKDFALPGWPPPRPIACI